MTQFKRGDMVECVDAEDRYPEHTDSIWEAALELGRFYTVKELCGESWISGKPTVALVETDHGPFDADRFRLIKPPATDISALTEIVRKVFAGGKVTA